MRRPAAGAASIASRLRASRGELWRGS